MVQLTSRRGLTIAKPEETRKARARRRVVNGETYAQCICGGMDMYLWRAVIACRATSRKSIWWDTMGVACVGGSANAERQERPGQPEEAVTPEKRFYVERIAGRFLSERRTPGVCGPSIWLPWRPAPDMLRWFVGTRTPLAQHAEMFPEPTRDMADFGLHGGVK
jgi:hypothetical protein